MCMWMHLGPLVGGFVNLFMPIPFLSLIVTIVLYYTQKDKGEFVRQHGKESLNFQITLALAMVVILIIILITFGSSILSMIVGGVSDNLTSTTVGIMGLMGSGILIAFFCLAYGIFSIVVMIIASVRASDGKVYRYPLSVRLVK